MSEVPPPSGPPEDSSGSIGLALASMRRKRGWTGQQLGQQVGISQAKISKIETGAISASPADVEKIAKALGAPPEVVRRLTDQADRSHNEMIDWRVLDGVAPARQRELTQAETSSSVVRDFQNAAVGGLLQTTEYARAILTALRAQLPDPRPELTPAVAETVSARIRRQEILANPSKRFVFIMTEGALQHPPCPPVDMLSQIERIRRVSGQHNVTIGFLPPGHRPLPPLHGFHLIDDRFVLIDLLNTALTTRGRADIQFYRQLFDSFEDQAIIDIDPILDRYRDFYLDLASRAQTPRTGE
jgi:transcriptional regulator with XRE-family HTH domain